MNDNHFEMVVREEDLVATKPGAPPVKPAPHYNLAAMNMGPNQMGPGQHRAPAQSEPETPQP